MIFFNTFFLFLRKTRCALSVKVLCNGETKMYTMNFAGCSYNVRYFMFYLNTVFLGSKMSKMAQWISLVRIGWEYTAKMSSCTIQLRTILQLKDFKNKNTMDEAGETFKYWICSISESCTKK